MRGVLPWGMGKPRFRRYNPRFMWGRSSAGRASRSHREGQGFKSPRLHQSSRFIQTRPRRQSGLWPDMPKYPCDRTGLPLPEHENVHDSGPHDPPSRRLLRPLQTRSYRDRSRLGIGSWQFVAHPLHRVTVIHTAWTIPGTWPSDDYRSGAIPGSPLSWTADGPVIDFSLPLEPHPDSTCVHGRSQKPN